LYSPHLRIAPSRLCARRTRPDGGYRRTGATGCEHCVAFESSSCRWRRRCATRRRLAFNNANDGGGVLPLCPYSRVSALGFSRPARRASPREPEFRQCSPNDASRSNARLGGLVGNRLRTFLSLCARRSASSQPKPVIGNRQSRNNPKPGSVSWGGWHRPGWVAMDSCVSIESDLVQRCDCGSGSHGGRKNALLRFGVGLAHLRGDRLNSPCLKSKHVAPKMF
jgi:hypothetical protein